MLFLHLLSFNDVLTIVYYFRQFILKVKFELSLDLTFFFFLQLYLKDCILSGVSFNVANSVYVYVFIDKALTAMCSRVDCIETFKGRRHFYYLIAASHLDAIFVTLMGEIVVCCDIYGDLAGNRMTFVVGNARK